MKKDEALVQLSRLALAGRRQDIQMYIRRMARSKELEGIRDELNRLLHSSPSLTAPTKSRSFSAVPVDMDSRLQLIRFEHNPSSDVKPIWTSDIAKSLEQIIEERGRLNELSKAGLVPTRTVLFIGEPGVGKTLAAKWLAQELRLPLLVLDLSAVMSSFLGRTGTNLRMVLDYAKSIECVLLLDEIDAIAKRRDDTAEIGELKRLVNVLLQEIDDWPANNLMVAATNHPTLLDPAIWRRFEKILGFPLPEADVVRQALNEYLRIGGQTNLDGELLDALVLLFDGKSFSDIELASLQLRKEMVLQQTDLASVVHRYITDHAASISKERRREMGNLLVSMGHSQRKVSNLLNMGRDTLRKAKG